MFNKKKSFRLFLPHASPPVLKDCVYFSDALCYNAFGALRRHMRFGGQAQLPVKEVTP
jgi:hypothetical protein